MLSQSIQMTTPPDPNALAVLVPANATEAVAKPVPPEGMRLLTEPELTRPFPRDALAFNPDYPQLEWFGSSWRGEIPPDYVTKHFIYATAQPTPSGPTAGDSMDVHLKAAREEIERLKRQGEEAAKMWAHWQTEYTKASGELFRANASLVAHKNGMDEALRLLANRDAALTTAETKAGSMEEALEAERTKWKEMAKDFETAFRLVRKENDDALARAETIIQAWREVEPVIMSRIVGRRADIINRMNDAITLPPAPSVASEKEGQ